MNKLKKLSASVVVTLALTTPAFGGVIECPLAPPTPPQSSPVMMQSGPTVVLVSTEAGGAESDDDNSLKGAVLSLLESVVLALF